MKRNIIASVLALSTMTSLLSAAAAAAPTEPAQTGAYSVSAQSTDYDWRTDAGNIILSPGSNETELNFAWYSEQKGTPQVKLGTKEDLSNAVTYTGAATAIDKTTACTDASGNAVEGVTYTASNKVSTGLNVLAENTQYYYSYSWNGTDWSQVYSYNTYSFDTFQAILVGDPQIGASGSSGQGTVDDANILQDTTNWKKTLEQVTVTAPNASFILSAGDQIDYSSAGTNGSGYVIRELEFAGFSSPSLLRSLPLATTIGNHESLGDDYQYHYNNANTESNLGATNSGCDYYFSYGDTLFIILNSNNRNASEHEALMKEAIASDTDAVWRVVMFHHDIYGSGLPHSDVDGANLRTIFAPLMDEFDIDVCLTGHDHSYARTFQIVDGKAIVYGQTSAVDPEGTLYIAAGSASGSKFYDLNTVKQYYIAERNNTKVPTFSTIDFSDGALTIKTYDYNGNRYAVDFTIEKTQSAPSVLSLIEEADALNAADYTKASFQSYTAAVNAAKALLETDRDGVPAILTANYDNTIQGNNEQDVLNYYAYAVAPYKDEASQRLAAGFSAFLDKTMNNAQSLIEAESFQVVYQKLTDTKAALLSSKLPYSDTKSGDWFYDAVSTMYDEGIMLGMTETTFEPDTTLTRAQFVTMLYRLDGSPAVDGTVAFTDVEAGAYYEEAVRWAVEQGIITGVNATTFAPNEALTREQMATILYRYTAPERVNSSVLSTFSDCDAVSAYAQDAMAWAVSEGLIQGITKTELAPAGIANRAQVATITARYIAAA